MGIIEAERDKAMLKVYLKLKEKYDKLKIQYDNLTVAHLNLIEDATKDNEKLRKRLKKCLKKKS